MGSFEKEGGGADPRGTGEAVVHPDSRRKDAGSDAYDDE